MKGGYWNHLPDYWRSTLKLWAALHSSRGTTNWKLFAQTMPFWDNLHFTFGKLKAPLRNVSPETVNKLMELGFNRLQDFVDFNGTFATADILRLLLNEDDFARPSSLTRLVNDTIRRLSLIIPGDTPHYGPSRPYKIEAACHAWSLDGKLVVDMENRDFVKLLLLTHKYTSTPDLPLRQLNLLPDFTPTPSMWTAEYTWDRYVLPVCSDVKFRLQHNALGVRYKFKWRTEVNMATTCIHGCIDVEDAKHLFWDCHVASHQWNYYLKPFDELIEGDLDWTMVIFASTYQLTPTATKLYGISAIQVVLNIIRCCVLRALWLHRNNKLYNTEVTTSAGFVCNHARA
ncbi:hypothetical protein Plhal703r1_c82g0173921 [Plasmopara halstedii]